MGLVERDLRRAPVEFTNQWAIATKSPAVGNSVFIGVHSCPFVVELSGVFSEQLPRRRFERRERTPVNRARPEGRQGRQVLRRPVALVRRESVDRPLPV